MSIYKKEASLEEMKREAISRMELLKLDAQTVREFEQDGSVSLSQQIGDQVFLHSSDDEICERVKRFEQEYECLVYHVLWADSPMVGECWSLLFVSPASSDWKGEQNTSTAPVWSMPMWSRRWRTVSARSWCSPRTAV